MLKKGFLCLGIVGLMFLMVGCINVDSIKTDFETAGYSYSEDASIWISGLLTELNESGISVTVHVFTSGLKTAIVLEFDSSKNLKAQLEESETLQGLVADLDEKAIVRGNFLLIPIALTDASTQEMIDIFNGDYELAK